MNKKHGGDRKRTVTITITPEEETMIEALIQKIAAKEGGLRSTPTSIVSACMRSAMIDWCRMHKIDYSGSPILTAK